MALASALALPAGPRALKALILVAHWLSLNSPLGNAAGWCTLRVCDSSRAKAGYRQSAEAHILGA